MRKLCVSLFVIAAMGAFVFSANTARAAMSDGDFIDLCASGSLAEIQAAIKDGANVNAKDKYGATALMWAAGFSANPEVISLLLGNGADVNAKDNYGYTALMSAANSGNPESISILLENGADINAKTYNGWTALMWAAEFNENPEVISLLLENGADVAITNDEGKKAIDLMRVPDENSSGEYKSAYQSLKNASK
jgi:ankyrin repeat protein